MRSIDKKVRIGNKPIKVNEKMLVGYDLFKYVFRKQRERKESERSGRSGSSRACKREEIERVVVCILYPVACILNTRYNIQNT